MNENTTTPTVQVTAPGVVRVRLTVTSNSDCGEDTDEVELVVNPSPATLSKANVPDVSRCGAGSVTLTATGAPADGTYRWYTEPTGNELAFTGSVFETPALDVSTTYYVAAVSAAGCESAGRIPVTAIIRVEPTAVIRAESPQCDNPNGPNVFGLTGESSSQNYIWELVDEGGIATISGEKTLTPLVTVTGTGSVTIRLTVTSDNGCVPAVEELELVVEPIPGSLTQADVTGATRCGPGQVTLLARGAPAGGAYRWYGQPIGGQILSTSATFTPTVSQTTTYYVAAVSSAQCESISRVAVTATVNELPIANAGTDQALCRTGTRTAFALAGSASGGTVLWELISGDALISTPSSLTTTVQVAGATATIRLTVTSPENCVSTDDVVLNVTPLPVVYAVTGASSYCIGSPGVSIGMQNSEAGVSYSLFKNGATEPLATVARTTTGAFSFGSGFTAGTYSVIATTIANQPNTAACPRTMGRGLTVTENQLPLAFSATGGSYCAGSGGAEITLTGSEAGIRYQLVRVSNNQNVGALRLGDGTPLSFGQQLAGKYKIVATNSSSSCSRDIAVPEVVEQEVLDPLGDIVIRNAAGEIISPSQLVAGEGASFTVVSDIIDNNDLEAIRWYTGDGNDVNWELVQTGGLVFEIAEVPVGALFSVRAEVYPVDGACYTVAFQELKQPLLYRCQWRLSTSGLPGKGIMYCWSGLRPWRMITQALKFRYQKMVSTSENWTSLKPGTEMPP
ncbi:hypothetical protein GCM10028895_44950 [Pontibacter rugosus]